MNRNNKNKYGEASNMNSKEKQISFLNRFLIRYVFPVLLLPYIAINSDFSLLSEFVSLAISFSLPIIVLFITQPNVWKFIRFGCKFF